LVFAEVILPIALFISPLAYLYATIHFDLLAYLDKYSSFTQGLANSRMADSLQLSPTPPSPPFI
jgi:hypothetical protein